MFVVTEEAPVFWFLIVIALDEGNVLSSIKIQVKIQGLSLKPSICWSCSSSLSADCVQMLFCCLPHKETREKRRERERQRERGERGGEGHERDR